jgi:proteic killer suppression protein
MIARHGVHIFAGGLDLLSALNVASTLQDLSPLKSVGLHKLKGDRKGQWAMTLNARWRICFVFRKGDAHDVEIVDHHKGYAICNTSRQPLEA